jgi:hypothetical protein
LFPAKATSDKIKFTAVVQWTLLLLNLLWFLINHIELIRLIKEAKMTTLHCGVQFMSHSFRTSSKELKWAVKPMNWATKSKPEQHRGKQRTNGRRIQNYTYKDYKLMACYNPLTSNSHMLQACCALISIQQVTLKGVCLCSKWFWLSELRKSMRFELISITERQISRGWVLPNQTVKCVINKW